MPPRCHRRGSSNRAGAVVTIQHAAPIGMRPRRHPPSPGRPPCPCPAPSLPLSIAGMPKASLKGEPTRQAVRLRESADAPTVMSYPHGDHPFVLRQRHPSGSMPVGQKRRTPFDSQRSAAGQTQTCSPAPTVKAATRDDVAHSSHSHRTSFAARAAQSRPSRCGPRVDGADVVPKCVSAFACAFAAPLSSLVSTCHSRRLTVFHASGART